MAPKYRLIYSGHGMVEITQLCLAAAGVDYEDVMVDAETWTTEWKDKSPFHRPPCLEVDGCLLSESATLLRYVARNHGLEGRSPLECGQVDMVSERLLEVKTPLVIIYREQDPTRKNALMETMMSETFPKMLSDAELYLSTNDNGQGYFVGDSLTYCDLVMFEILENVLSCFDPDLNLLESCPLLKAHKNRIANVPRIKACLEKRQQIDS